MNTDVINAELDEIIQPRLEALHTAGYELGRKQLAEDIRHLIGAATQAGR